MFLKSRTLLAVPGGRCGIFSYGTPEIQIPHHLRRIGIPSYLSVLCGLSEASVQPLSGVAVAFILAASFLALGLLKSYLSGMGFYATEQLEAVLESHQENGHPPSKNRVWNFFTTSDTCAGFFESQPVESHQEKWPTPTIIVSGVHFYGYRYYQPEIGRWVNRDPLDELGFQLIASYPVENENDPIVLLSRVLMKLQAENSDVAEFIRSILLQWRITYSSNAGFDPGFCNYLHNDPINQLDPFGLEDAEKNAGEACPKCDTEAEKKLIEELISKLNGQISKLPGKAGNIAKIIKNLEKIIKDGKTCGVMAKGSACKDFLDDIEDPSKCYQCCMSTQPNQGVGHFVCTGACGVTYQ